MHVDVLGIVDVVHRLAVLASGSEPAAGAQVDCVRHKQVPVQRLHECKFIRDKVFNGEARDPRPHVHTVAAVLDVFSGQLKRGDQDAAAAGNTLRHIFAPAARLEDDRFHPRDVAEGHLEDRCVHARPAHNLVDKLAEGQPEDARRPHSLHELCAALNKSKREPAARRRGRRRGGMFGR